jgi:hypothetical protein
VGLSKSRDGPWLLYLKELKAQIAPNQVPSERVGFVDETRYIVGQPRVEVELCGLLSKQATRFPKDSLSVSTVLVSILSYLTS